jgi:hypothetical protein
MLLNPRSIANRQLTLSTDLAQQGSSDRTREISERWLKNGFKALELSRKCLTALNEVRSPKKSATFIKNQIAQQVNQLQLGENNAPQMDGRTATKTERADSELATLDAIDGR